MENPNQVSPLTFLWTQVAGGGEGAHKAARGLQKAFRRAAVEGEDAAMVTATDGTMDECGNDVVICEDFVWA
ncbi:bifunctional aminodeoxychorismate synthase component [Sesbania bispinosa]|nr:bifunctional aminodeoxychorismate synthase component [Sesbania bispinosa]